MSLIVSENGNGGGFPIIPEGTYPATCYMLVDLGLQENKKYGNSSPKVLVGWELADEFIEIDGKKQPRIFSARYTASLASKAILRRDLAAWRGRDFTDEELAKFNLRNILGASCLIQIIHKTGGDGKTYANLASVMKLPKNMPAPTKMLDQVVYDIDENPLDDVEKLPEWIANTIKLSESYKARFEAEAAKQRDKLNDIPSLDGVVQFEDYDDEDGLPF